MKRPLRRICAVLACTAAAVAWFGAASAQEAGSRSLSVSLTLGNTEVTADWTLPSGEAIALVIVQHGFARRCNHLHGTLQSLAQHGLMVLCLNAEMAGGNPALADALAVALLAGLAPPGEGRLPDKIIVGGHSAGALFAAHVGAALALGAPDRLAGALLFDPVAGAGFAADLLAISAAGSRTVRAISAGAGGCNAQNSADPALRAVQRATLDAGRNGFVGLRLTDRSTHLDAEGDDTSALAVWACGQGRPQPANTAALRTLAALWAVEMALGKHDAEAEPGAAFIKGMLDDGRAVLIE